jgi:hypothetical protein
MAQHSASRVALLLSALTLAAALGCGSPATTTPTTSYLNISGNWDIVGTGDGLTQPISGIFGALQASNGAVTGTIHAFGSNLTASCVSLTQDLPVTGTIDAANNLTLNVAIAGGTATIQGALTQDLQAFSDGTYSIAGGACAMSSASMVAYQIPPITGTYTGTFTLSQSSPVVTAAVTAQLTQSSTPTADGYFPLSGTISIPGGCPSSVSVTNEVLMGTSIEDAPLVTGSPSLLGIFFPAVPPFPFVSSIQATVGASSSNCSPRNSVWTGTLTPQ